MWLVKSVPCVARWGSQQAEAHRQVKQQEVKVSHSWAGIFGNWKTFFCLICTFRRGLPQTDSSVGLGRQAFINRWGRGFFQRCLQSQMLHCNADIGQKLPACGDFLLIVTTQAYTNLSEQLMFLPFDAGSTQFPYNPLTMRMLSSTPPTSIACAPPSMSQATTHPQNRIWEREPAPLLSAQYETLSDSDDWTMQIIFFFFLICGSKKEIYFWLVPTETFQESKGHTMKNCWRVREMPSAQAVCVGGLWSRRLTY